MKLSALSKLVKKTTSCEVITKTADSSQDEMIVSIGNAALYKCGALPDVHGKEQIAALFSLDQKQTEEILCIESEYFKPEDVKGFDLSDGTYPYENDTTETAIQVSYKDRDFLSLSSGDGEIIFLDRKYLTPFKEEMKSPYFCLKGRFFDNGNIRFQYIAVKDGMRTLAVIMPIKVCEEDFVSALNRFADSCKRQQGLEEMRRLGCDRRNGGSDDE